MRILKTEKINLETSYIQMYLINGDKAFSSKIVGIWCNEGCGRFYTKCASEISYDIINSDNVIKLDNGLYLNTNQVAYYDIKVEDNFIEIELVEKEKTAIPKWRKKE